MSASQAESCEFDPRRPLQKKISELGNHSRCTHIICCSPKLRRGDLKFEKKSATQIEFLPSQIDRLKSGSEFRKRGDKNGRAVFGFEKKLLSLTLIVVTSLDTIGLGVENTYLPLGKFSLLKKLKLLSSPSVLDNEIRFCIIRSFAHGIVSE